MSAPRLTPSRKTTAQESEETGEGQVEASGPVHRPHAAILAPSSPRSRRPHQLHPAHALDDQRSTPRGQFRCLYGRSSGSPWSAEDLGDPTPPRSEPDKHPASSQPPPKIPLLAQNNGGELTRSPGKLSVNASRLPMQHEAKSWICRWNAHGSPFDAEGSPPLEATRQAMTFQSTGQGCPCCHWPWAQTVEKAGTHLCSGYA